MAAVSFSESSQSHHDTATDKGFKEYNCNERERPKIHRHVAPACPIGKFERCESVHQYAIHAVP